MLVKDRSGKLKEFLGVMKNREGCESAVGIATCYGLDGPGIESQWGARFSAPVQTDPGVHPASYTMGTGSFKGSKRPGRGVDRSHLSSAEVKERVKLYIMAAGESVAKSAHFTVYLRRDPCNCDTSTIRRP